MSLPKSAHAGARIVKWVVFAESFLGPRAIFGCGEKIDHLEAAAAETTIGRLQSTVVGSPEFLQVFQACCDLAETRLCAVSFTILPADKDDPRFDRFYLGGNKFGDDSCRSQKDIIIDYDCPENFADLTDCPAASGMQPGATTVDPA